MTLVLTVDTEFNNPDAPYITLYDPIESRDGSLFLWDAGRAPLGSMPAIGASLPNLLSEYVNASGKEFTFAMGGSSQVVHDSYVRRELTAKKGLHWMASQSRATDLPIGNTYYAIKANAALKSHMAANIMGATPSIFISLWTNHTRHVTKVDGVSALMTYLNGNTTNYAARLEQKTGNIIVGGNPQPLLSTSKLNLTSLQSAIVSNPNFYQANINKYAGTGIISSNDLFIGSGQFIPYSGSVVGNQALNASPSYILYRVYVEDLSLSGRTFDQVRAIDEAEHVKAFGIGGRFYGDTWSNPATLLP